MNLPGLRVERHTRSVKERVSREERWGVTAVVGSAWPAQAWVGYCATVRLNPHVPVT